MIRAIMTCLLVAALAAPALAIEPLNEEAHINESLIAAQAGDILRETCPTISARMVVVLTKARALEQYARDKGYTEPEVKKFLKNRDEKARVRAAAEAYLAAAGAVPGDVDSYCRVGRAEIEKDTLLGQLIWSSE